jgi:hypothetical protein
MLDLKTANELRRRRNIRREEETQLKQLQGEFALSPSNTKDFTQLSSGQTVNNLTLQGTTTDSSTTTHSGAVTYNSTVTLNSTSEINDIMTWKAEARAESGIAVYGSSTDAAPTVMTSTIGTDQLVLPGDLSCVNGIFGASTVKIGDQTIGEDGELLIQDPLTPGIKIKDTGGAGAAATGYVYFLDSAGATQGHLYLNNQIFYVVSPNGDLRLESQNVGSKIALFVGSDNLVYVKGDADFVIEPTTDNQMNLGTATKEFKNLYIDGTAKIDTLTVDVAAGFTGQVDFAGGVVYKVQNDGDAFFKNLDCAGNAVIDGTGLTTGVHTFTAKIVENGGVSTAAEAHLMIGSGNKAWIPCTLDGSGYVSSSNGDLIYAATTIGNISGNDGYLRFIIPLPTNRGGLKLYCKDVKITLQDADAAAYVDEIVLQGVTNTGGASVLTDATNRTTAGDHTTSNTADDMSGYDHAQVRVKIMVDAAGELDISGVYVECYYDT